MANQTNSAVEALKLVGGLAGILTFFWKILESSKTYLKIKVEVNSDEFSILSEIENNSFFDKHILYTFLLITPEHEPLSIGAEKIRIKLNLQEPVSSINDFVHFQANKPFYLENKYALIPLTYFYRENIAIGDEKLTYKCSVEKDHLSEGTFSVRFFVFHKKRYHRCTQDLLIIENK